MTKRNAGMNLKAAARPTSPTRQFACSSPKGLSSRRAMSPPAFVRSIPALFNDPAHSSPELQFARHLARPGCNSSGPHISFLHCSPGSRHDRGDGLLPSRCSRACRKPATPLHDSRKMNDVQKELGSEMPSPRDRTDAPCGIRATSICDRQANDESEMRVIC